MNLPITVLQLDALFALLDGLAALALDVVLVGGLVPPLLLEALEPDLFMEDVHGRQTKDCDLAVAITVGDNGRAQLDAIEALLAGLGWRRGRANQFRWEHGSRLPLDVLPVPDGIEAGATAAVALARTWVDSDVATFYRGYELALEDHVVIEIAHGATTRTLQIAGLLPMLAMKLQAWDDRPERQRDAHDVALLLRFTSLDTAVAALRRGEARRPDLVREVLARLRQAFTGPWERGVLAYAAEAFRYRDDDVTEPERNAVAFAVLRLLDAMTSRSADQ